MSDDAKLSKEDYHLPYRKRKNGDGEEIAYFVGEAEEKLRSLGIYYITGEIDDGGLLEIQQDILYKHLDSSWNKEIQIIINSYGGSCAETWALVDLLDHVRMPIHTVGMGFCASAGAVLLAAGSKGKRRGTKNLEVMIHTSYNHLEGKHEELIAQIKDSVDEYERDLRFWIEHSNYTTREQVKRHLLKGQDLYLTSSEAHQHGIIDYIVGPGGKTIRTPRMEQPIQKLCDKPTVDKPVSTSNPPMPPVDKKNKKKRKKKV